jgi:hypothetical protein
MHRAEADLRRTQVGKEHDPYIPQAPALQVHIP